jgi:hypothetical protein
VYLCAVLLIEFTLTAIAAVSAAVNDVHPNELSGYSIVVLLAFGMGIRNAAVRRIAVPDLTTPVLTLTPIALAADSRLAGGTGRGTGRRVSGAAAIALIAGTSHAEVARREQGRIGIG